MNVLKARNVHEALPEALQRLWTNHRTTDSRNGPVWVAPLPGVCTVYSHPCERVLFWSERDANPFFHLMEGLWMLAGRRDVAWIRQFNSKFGQFSDDGKVFHGAYGHRWRFHFDHDQLDVIAEHLTDNPHCRRQVLTMWDPRVDLGEDGKDFPCNTQCYFQRDPDGVLHMAVTCRSNDILWGCYGANAVHFSMLQEYMAARIGCPVGTMTQVSFNWHAYLATTEHLMKTLRLKAREPRYARHPLGENGYYNPYENGDVVPLPMIEGYFDDWTSDLDMFMDEGPDAVGYRTRFFRRVAIPLYRAYMTFKHDEGPTRYAQAQELVLYECKATDWSRACWEWLERRRKRAGEK